MSILSLVFQSMLLSGAIVIVLFILGLLFAPLRSLFNSANVYKIYLGLVIALTVIGLIA